MDKRYPIGLFQVPTEKDEEQLQAFLEEIQELPQKLRAAVEGLTEDDLDTAYREGGWTIRQVIHHVADSHMNGFVRMKLALTESIPIIKPFEETAWAMTGDAKEAPVALSLSLLDGLHDRWAFLLKGLKADDFRKAVYHPDSNKELDVYTLTALYAWHGKHHTAHITNAFH
jgi:hypothetical protein